MASNNVATLCLKVPDTMDPQTVALITDLFGKLGLAEVGNAEVVNAEVANAEVGNAEVLNAEVGNAEVLNAEVANAEVGNAEVLNAEVGNAEVLNAEVGNAEVQNAPKEEDKKTVVLITEDCGGVVLKILSRLAALVGCAAVVYAAFKIADGVDTWKEVGCKIAEGVDTWKEAGCNLQMNLENLTIFEKFSVWST